MVSGLDREINIHYNSLGLVGPELPLNYDSCLSIVTVGGSTTFGWCLSSDKTWPYLLSRELSKTFRNTWLNNAGMPGQSTYGHIIMLKDHLVKLKPKVIIFMAGINDIGRADISSFDSVTVQSPKQFLLTHSETVNLLVAFMRNKRAIERKLNNVQVDFRDYDTLAISEKVIQQKLQEQQPFVARYTERICTLMEICVSNNIIPVLMTQPFICGITKDSTTGADLAKIKVKPDLNGELWYRQVDLYNQAMKKVATRYNVLCIDLSSMLPKDSRYFFDYIHHTNEGARKITELITPDLKKYLASRFPAYLRNVEQD